MTAAEPPRIATWMLAHLMPADYDDALAGDLLESFRAGRSSGWYCRQVLVALVIRWIGSFYRHRAVLIFAMAWATLSPAWRLLIIRLDHWSNFIGPVWRLPWPWSTVCMMSLSTAESLLFIWTGVLPYLVIVLRLFRIETRWRIGRAFAASLVSYAMAVACEIAIALIATPSSTQHGVDWRALTLQGVITNFGVWTIFMRIPFLIGTACALWGAVPSREQPVKLAE